MSLVSGSSALISVIRFPSKISEPESTSTSAGEVLSLKTLSLTSAYALDSFIYMSDEWMLRYIRLREKVQLVTEKEA